MANMLMTRFCMYIKDCQFEKSTLDLCRDNRNCNRSKILCSTSRGNRGFGPRPLKKEKTNKGLVPKDGAGLGPQTRKSTTDMSDTKPNEAPDLIGRLDGKSGNNVLDRQFEERLEAVRRSAFEQKKVDDSKQYGPIDYDTPVDSNQSTIGLGTKIGVGVAVVVFGLVFAFGDFLPSISVDPADEAPIVDKKLTDEEKSTFQTRLQQLEAKLSISPEDPDALEGAAVTLSELGEYGRAASLLENLAKKKARDPDVYRLLGEVKYLLKDYEGSATAYRSSASVSESFNLEVLRGLTNSLLAAKKPDEAVQVLLDFRQRLNTENSNSRYVDAAATTSNLAMDAQKIDPIQVELLLGKAYSDWGHVSDAVAVYDQLISKYPNDFRGYLAKGIILKENGKVGDAERMFIQARFFAPEKAKILVDRYSKK